MEMRQLSLIGRGLLRLARRVIEGHNPEQAFTEIVAELKLDDHKAKVLKHAYADFRGLPVQQVFNEGWKQNGYNQTESEES